MAKIKVGQRVRLIKRKPYTLCQSGQVRRVEVMYVVKLDDGFAFRYTEEELKKADTP